MKGKSSILSALLILTLGVVLIIINKSLDASGVVMCGGVLFLVAAVLNIFFFLSEDSRKNSRRRGGPLTKIFGWISSVAGIILGLCMLLFESVFTPLIPFIFGGLLVLAAVFHFYVLAISYRPIVFPGWLYIIPALLTAAGVWVFFIDGSVSGSLMMILTGSGLCLFSTGVFIESVFIHMYNKKAGKAVDSEKGVAEPPHAAQDAVGAGISSLPSAEIKTLDD